MSLHTEVIPSAAQEKTQSIEQTKGKVDNKTETDTNMIENTESSTESSETCVDVKKELATEADGPVEEKKVSTEVTTEEAETESSDNNDESPEADETEDYHGTRIRPLSSFGSFDIDDKISSLKWIHDHTSGDVHKDIPTISMLYNQNLTLPEAATHFIAQSPKLTEEARWEKSKARFYTSFDERKRNLAYDTLSKTSVFEASRIISLRISRDEHEVILKPVTSLKVNKNLVNALVEEIPKMLKTAEKSSDKCGRDAEKARDALESFSSFGDGCLLQSHQTIKSRSLSWTQKVEHFNTLRQSQIEADLFAIQLQLAKVRYEPRTRWIHVKTFPLCADYKEEASILTRISNLLRHSKGKTREDLFQIERFEYGLQKYGTGMFKNFDSLHNNDMYEGFDFLVPYDKISPDSCVSVLLHSFPELKGQTGWEVISRPVISDFPTKNHEVKIYFDKRKHDMPSESVCQYSSILKASGSYSYLFCIYCCGSHAQTSCRDRPTRESGFHHFVSLRGNAGGS